MLERVYTHEIEKTVLRTSFVLSIGLSTVVPSHIACAQTKPVSNSSESAAITTEEIQELTKDITFIFEKIEEKFGLQVDLNQLAQFKAVLSASFLSILSAHITNKGY
ncbi:TPA: hypothetical protein RMI67_005895 [Bacillus cereus]|nr:hypothetical protein [Bacillus cereus]